MCHYAQKYHYITGIMGSRPCATQKLENPSLGGEAVKPLPSGIEKWDTAGIFCSFLHCYILSQTQTAPGTQYVLSENSIVNESLHKKWIVLGAFLKVWLHNV